MTPIKTAALILAAGAIGATGFVHAQVFKCVDASGKTVYSQSACPKDSRATTLQRSAPKPAATAKGDAKADGKGGDPKADTAPGTVADQELAFRKRRQEQEDAAKKQEQKVAESQERAQNCQSARSQLVNLENSPRQSRFDAKGERYFMDEAELEREKERARRAMDSWCK